MATPRQYEVKKYGEETPCGIFTKNEISKKLLSKELSFSDSIRDHSKTDSPWELLSDFRKPSNNQASVPRSEHTAVTIPVASSNSHALPQRQPPAKQQSISSTPASGERSHGTRPSAESSAWTHKQKVGLMAISCSALALTLLNTGWLLFAGASQVQPASNDPQASARAPAPESGSAPSGATTAPVKGGSPAKPAKNAETAGTATKLGAAANSVGDQGLAAAASEAKLDQLNEKIERLLKHLPPQGKRAILLEAIQAGEWRYRIGDTEYVFIYIPAGTFLFGYPSEDQDRVIRVTGNPNAFLNASPICQIRVSRGFFMLDREVTNSQWDSCLKPMKEGDTSGSTGTAPTEPETRDLPKRNVTWLEAVDFCQAFQKAAEDLELEWSFVRLPTEIEWEYAGRGAQGTLLPWIPDAKNPETFVGNAQPGTGGPIVVDPINLKDCSWRRQFHFAGNLAEWCLDRYDQDLHESLLKTADGKPAALYSSWSDELVRKALANSKADLNPSRTFRGGSFADLPANCELPMRRFFLQNKGADHIGFRPVIVLNDSCNATSQEKMMK